MIDLSSSNAAEGTVKPAKVTFTTDNWDKPQTVTVTGVSDSVTDGNKLYTIVTSPAKSADPTFSGVDPSDVSVTNQDDDSGSFDIQVTMTGVPDPVSAGGNVVYTITVTNLGPGRARRSRNLLLLRPDDRHGGDSLVHRVTEVVPRTTA